MQMLRDMRALKSPTGARRTWGLITLALISLSRLVSAQAENTQAARLLSEADVIQRARTHSPAAAVAGATDVLAEAHSRAAGLLPNPSLSWGRETIQTGPVATGGSQDILTAAVPVDVARPLSARSLAASEGAWMHAEASLSRTDGMLAAVLAYYEVVLAERRAAELEQVVADLEEAARVLTRREEAGSASGYERARLTIARELSFSHLAQARGQLESSTQRLGTWLGLRRGSFRVATSIELISESAEAELMRDRGQSRRAMQSARESQRLAVEADDRAGWAWLPSLELAGGMKRANNTGTASGFGYVLGVSLSIPVLDHGQAQRAQGRAQRMLAQARSEALSRTIAADLQSALATFRAARRELRRFEAQTSDQVEVLLTAAQSGYREGERSIVELLDAQRARADVAEQRLSLLGTAKRAEVRLRAAAGELQ